MLAGRPEIAKKEQSAVGVAQRTTCEQGNMRGLGEQKLKYEEACQAEV